MSCNLCVERRLVSGIKGTFGRDTSPNGTGMNSTQRNCFLNGKSRYFENSTSVCRPLIVETLSSWLQHSWCDQFATKANIEMSEALYVFENATRVLLCDRHRSMSRNVALSVVAELEACTICGNVGDRRYCGRVTKFNWERIALNVEARCVMEDAVALYTDNRLYAGAIDRLCDLCRLVVCRGLDMKGEAIVVGDHGCAPFDYGKSKRAVQRCISWVRDRLLRQDQTNSQEAISHVIFLTEVFGKYQEYVVETGEQGVAFTQTRDLRRFLQPHLAASGTHCERTDAYKIGYYFCTLNTFKQLAKEAAGKKKEQFSVSILEEERELDNFGAYLQSRESDIERFTWALEDFISAIGYKIWLREMLLKASDRMIRRCRSSARLQGKVYSDIWPCNPSECPTLSQLTQNDLSFIISTYFTFERKVFIRSEHTIRSPMVTAMSFVGMNAASVSFISLFSRVGCTVSYPILESMRKVAILRRKEKGDFAGIDRSSFLSCAIDNVNIRTGHSISVHGSTNMGFDSLAMQVVNSDRETNYEAFCVSQPLENSLLSKSLVGGREDFINRVVSDPNSHPNIVGFVILQLVWPSQTSSSS